MSKPLVYVAGPYSSGDPVVNTQRAITRAEELYGSGLVVPFIPHLSIAWHLVSPHPLEFWYTYDLAILQHCDALLRIEGGSQGADAEVDEATRLEIPVFFQNERLLTWAKRRNGE